MPPPQPPPFANRPKLDCLFVLSSAFVLDQHLTPRKRDKNNLMLQLRNGKRAACNHGVMDARGRFLSTKEA